MTHKKSQRELNIFGLKYLGQSYIRIINAILQQNGYNIQHVNLQVLL